MRARALAASVVAALLGVAVPAIAAPDAAPGRPASETPSVLRDVGFDQKLGATVPLDIPLRDESGAAVRLRDYFGRVADLEVEVEMLEVTTEGDRHTVRFTRRDRFRDPGGSLVSKETPPIEKDVVQSGAGLRFAPSRQ